MDARDAITWPLIGIRSAATDGLEAVHRPEVDREALADAVRRIRSGVAEIEGEGIVFARHEMTGTIDMVQMTADETQVRVWPEWSFNSGPFWMPVHSVEHAPQLPPTGVFEMKVKITMEVVA